MVDLIEADVIRFEVVKRPVAAGLGRTNNGRHKCGNVTESHLEESDNLCHITDSLASALITVCRYPSPTTLHK